MSLLVLSSISCISSCKSDRILLLWLVALLEAVEESAAIRRMLIFRTLVVWKLLSEKTLLFKFSSLFCSLERGFFGHYSILKKIIYVFRDSYLVAYAWKLLFNLNHLSILFQSEVFLFLSPDGLWFPCCFMIRAKGMPQFLLRKTLRLLLEESLQ